MTMQQKSGMIGLAVVLILLPFSISAQYEIKALPRWLMSLQFEYMNPTPPVDEFLDEDNLAFHYEIQYRLQYNKPFLGGLYFGDAGLSKYVLQYTWNSPDGAIEVREKANTRRVDFGFAAGFYPEINWLLQPYLQGRIGMAIFQSSSILTNADTEEHLDRISEMTSSTLNYGLDFGVHIVPNLWYIRGDVRVGFVANPSVTFLSLDEENAGTSGYPIDYFEEHTSAGSWLKLSIGVSYLF